MNKALLKKILIYTSIVVTLAITAFAYWVYRLDRSMQSRIQRQWFLPPVEIYARPYSVVREQQLNMPEVTSYLKNQDYRQREPGQKLFAHDYSIWPADECQASLMEPIEEEISNCLVIKTSDPQNDRESASETFLIALSEDSRAIALYSGQPFNETELIELEPQIFAQFYGGEPILRRLISIGQAPVDCLQAVTAIEDSQFLEHQGISVTGIARAFIKNISQGRVAEGGSTITQQLIKNYFLTSERSFRRKFKEMVMALLLESRIDKDKILENYLNVIYMGQNGPFQVRGYGAAAEHYFGRKLESIDLAQCALLAAIVNSPGRYNPFRHPDQARERRQLVVNRMLELGMISEKVAEKAKQAPLPESPPRTLSEPAPYFVQAIHKELEKINVDSEAGVRVFTSLDEHAQEQAQKSVTDGLAFLEKRYKTIKEQKEKGKHLEALIISVDLKTGDILALVGGRSFKATQYNRATQSHRQVGSVMKPFVYLAALESLTQDGLPYTPMTPIEDAFFRHKYEGQSWAPKNYAGQYRGSVPLFYALKSSLNAATARLGLDVGLTNIIDVARRAGVHSDIKPLPALTLGAFELYPVEVAQAYSTIANMGLYQPLRFIRKVEDLEGNTLFEHEPESRQVFSPETTAVLIGMLKETIRSGTGRSISSWRGFTRPAAGKTGTTSDTKDAWFAGFTPYVLTVAWVGYDDNTPHGLTGSSGAIPIWTQYMSAFAKRFPDNDFTWPQGVTQYDLSAGQLKSLLPSDEPEEGIQDTVLIFRSGNAPTF